MQASVIVACGFSSCSYRLSYSVNVGSSQRRDQIRVPYIGRLILNHWTTGEAPGVASLVVEQGSRCVGSVVVAHGLSCSVACEIFPDQGSNLGPLH